MTLEDIIEGILGKEGGFVDHPNDRGGPTNWGITERVAREHGYQGHMRDLPRDEAIRIIKADYWHKPRFAELAIVSMPIAVKLTDMGVNMGPAFGARTLQRWLNAFNRREPELAVDGIVGPRTRQALDIFIKARGKDGEEVLLKAINCTQGERYLAITESRRANESFIFGWVKNRVQL
jgi:lysozyme family protein